MTMFLLSTIYLFEFAILFVTSQYTGVINTTSGPVQGEILTTVWHSVQYASFKGIQYAEAPIGYRRFKPPESVKPWTDILNATKVGSECTQINDELSVIMGSEDCLYLNIYTPVVNLTKLADQAPSDNVNNEAEDQLEGLKSVMVFIHGGTWVKGSSTPKFYGPDFLIERDIVLVTLNYRLGALGFLNLNHPNATGNAGLKDQNLALKWIQANIEKFGGNPKNVTIFGQSAGAASVGFHTLSAASSGLFNAAISMSGTPLVSWGFQTPEKSIERAETLGTLIGTNSTDKEVLLAAFYNASAETLVNATDKNGLIISFAPTIENATIATDPFLTECSLGKYYDDEFNKVPQILGFMEQETLSEVTYVRPFLNLINEAIEIVDGSETNAKSILNGVADLLVDGLKNFKIGFIESAVNLTTDILFISPIDSTQKLLAEHNGNNPIYYYHITFYGNRSLHNVEYEGTPILGAAHTDDVAYVFYIQEMNYTLEANDPVTQMIYRMSTMWSNFAKYGNPTPDWVDEYPLNITWPNSGTDGIALNIGFELTVDRRPTDLLVKVSEILNGIINPNSDGCV